MRACAGIAISSAALPVNLKPGRWRPRRADAHVGPPAPAAGDRLQEAVAAADVEDAIELLQLELEDRLRVQPFEGERQIDLARLEPRATRETEQHYRLAFSAFLADANARRNGGTPYWENLESPIGPQHRAQARFEAGFRTRVGTPFAGTEWGFPLDGVSEPVMHDQREPWRYLRGIGLQAEGPEIERRRIRRLDVFRPDDPRTNALHLKPSRDAFEELGAVEIRRAPAEHIAEVKLRIVGKLCHAIQMKSAKVIRRFERIVGIARLDDVVGDACQRDERHGPCRKGIDALQQQALEENTGHLGGKRFHGRAYIGVRNTRRSLCEAFAEIAKSGNRADDFRHRRDARRNRGCRVDR